LQQEIAEASDAARKYYDEMPRKERSNTDVTVVMRAAAKSKQQSFKGQFFKYLAISNPKFGDRFLQEVSTSLLTLWQDILIQY
jgi:phosphoenolpyruvate synthase/pyruvate phosphate dikinase